MGKVLILPVRRPLSTKQFKEQVEGIVDGPPPQGDFAWYIEFQRIKCLVHRLREVDDEGPS